MKERKCRVYKRNRNSVNSVWEDWWLGNPHPRNLWPLLGGASLLITPLLPTSSALTTHCVPAPWILTATLWELLLCQSYRWGNPSWLPKATQLPSPRGRIWTWILRGKSATLLPTHSPPCNFSFTPNCPEMLVHTHLDWQNKVNGNLIGSLIISSACQEVENWKEVQVNCRARRKCSSCSGEQVPFSPRCAWPNNSTRGI